MMHPIVIGAATSSHRHTAAQSHAAQELEATFLAEMLKSAGLGATPDAFGGGSGETQFQSFLVQEQARHLAQAGGIGLAETIFAALRRAENEN